MKYCLARMLWIAMLLGAQPAAGQAPPATGTLTVLSRPAGASFRIAGEQVMVGRTPMTIDRGFIGRYELRSLDPSYGTWKRTMILGGGGADTVWMTLHPRTAAGAGLRSLVMPGWGQAYGQHPGRGVLFFSAAAVAGAGLTVAQVRYRHRLQDYRDADELYQSTSNAATLAARSAASGRSEDARRLRKIGVGVLGGVWAVNVLEAMIHFPSLPSDRLSLSVLPCDHTPGPAPVVALTVRF